MAFVDIVLGVSAQGSQAEDKEEGEKTGEDGSEETERTHGWIRRR